VKKKPEKVFLCWKFSILMDLFRQDPSEKAEKENEILIDKK
jgi:hypothetical protein